MRVTHFERLESFFNHCLKMDVFETLKKENLNDLGNVELEKAIERVVGPIKKDLLKRMNMYSFLVDYIGGTYGFYFEGKPVFSISEGLLPLLYQTDLGTISAEQVKLPFDSIYMTFPYGEVKTIINDVKFIVEGVYLTNLLYNYRKELGMYFILVTNSEKDKEQIIHSKTRFSVPLIKGREIQLLILEKFKENNLIGKELEKVINLLINSILYINSDKAIINKIPPKPQKRRKRPTKQSGIPHHVLGKSIVIDHSVTELVGDNKSNNNRHTKQWWVRGHWRNQAYGNKLKERKLIWIQPYLKGEGDGEVNPKPYDVIFNPYK